MVATAAALVAPDAVSDPFGASHTTGPEGIGISDTRVPKWGPSRGGAGSATVVEVGAAVVLGGVVVVGAAVVLGALVVVGAAVVVEAAVVLGALVVVEAVAAEDGAGVGPQAMSIAMTTPVGATLTTATAQCFPLAMPAAFVPAGARRSSRDAIGIRTLGT